MKKNLMLLSFVLLGFFVLFSFSVAKEIWKTVDFDSMVKLQDNISRRFDLTFSYFSLLGSAEITIGLSLVFAFLSFLKKQWLGILGWMMIIPASAVEVLGKLLLFHPGPPVFFHRSLLPTSLPSFYVQTDFSYPSGHMTRTIFIISILFLLAINSKKSPAFKSVALCLLFLLALFMAVTRVYLGEHWLSDVVGGTLLGISAGIFSAGLCLSKGANILIFSDKKV